MAQTHVWKPSVQQCYVWFKHMFLHSRALSHMLFCMVPSQTDQHKSKSKGAPVQRYSLFYTWLRSLVHTRKSKYHDRHATHAPQWICNRSLGVLGECSARLQLLNLAIVNLGRFGFYLCERISESMTIDVVFVWVNCKCDKVSTMGRVHFVFGDMLVS